MVRGREAKGPGTREPTAVVASTVCKDHLKKTLTMRHSNRRAAVPYGIMDFHTYGEDAPLILFPKFFNFFQLLLTLLTIF